VLSGRGLCDELITRPEESYRLWCVVVCDLETSRIGAPYIYDISSLRVKICRYFITVNFSQLFSDMTENNNEEVLWNRICLETLKILMDLLS